MKLGIATSKSATLIVHCRAWLEETHSTGFELRRHFFFRFFDSEFISTPGQGRIVAGGVFAILASLSIIFSQAYYHKYLALNGLPDRTEYDLSVVDDVLLLITLSMFLIGLLTTIEWPCLFPGLRDYMAFASLPIRARDLFIAKFTTMITVATLFITGVNCPPSLMLPMMMSGRYGAHSVSQIPGIFISAALALAVIVESFVSLRFNQNFRGFSIQTPGLRQAAISIPLALSLFILWGFRYLFRLPVELRANWIFQINEAGHGMDLLAGVKSFLLYCAVIPLALLTLPIEIRLLGAPTGFLASIVCALPSLSLMELLLIQLERVPFTSSYLPGQRPIIETAMIYLITVILYVFLFSTLVSWSLQTAGSATALIAILLVLWWRARKARLDLLQTGCLEFEEVPEPAVISLGIERD